MRQSNNLNDADYDQNDSAENGWSNQRKKGQIATFRRRTMLVTLEMMRGCAFNLLKMYIFDLRESHRKQTSRDRTEHSKCYAEKAIITHNKCTMYMVYSSRPLNEFGLIDPLMKKGERNLVVNHQTHFPCTFRH